MAGRCPRRVGVRIRSGNRNWDLFYLVRDLPEADVHGRTLAAARARSDVVEVEVAPVLTRSPTEVVAPFNDIPVPLCGCRLRNSHSRASTPRESSWRLGCHGDLEQ